MAVAPSISMVSNFIVTDYILNFKQLYSHFVYVGIYGVKSSKFEIHSLLSFLIILITCLK